MARKKARYSPEFREAAAKEVVERSRPVAEVARDLGVVEQTLGNWVKKFRESHPEDEAELSVSEQGHGPATGVELYADELRDVLVAELFETDAAESRDQVFGDVVGIPGHRGWLQSKRLGCEPVGEVVGNRLPVVDDHADAFAREDPVELGLGVDPGVEAAAA